MNEEYILFEAETHSTPSQIRSHLNNLDKRDKILPSGLIKAMTKGSEAVRNYWNQKNLRKRKVIEKNV